MEVYFKFTFIQENLIFAIKISKFAHSWFLDSCETFVFIWFECVNIVHWEF